MENKLKQANENIEELVDALIRARSQNYDHCCLRVVLLGKDRYKCGEIDCNECNYKARQEYKNRLLNRYIVE